MRVVLLRGSVSLSEEIIFASTIVPTTLEKIQKKARDEEALLKKQAECKHFNWAVICSCCGKVLGSEKTQEFGKIMREEFL